MKLYLIITIFQGIFDAIEVFHTEPEAMAYAEKLTVDFGPDDLEIVKRSIETDL